MILQNAMMKIWKILVMVKAIVTQALPHQMKPHYYYYMKPGAPLTSSASNILVMQFKVRHNLTDQSLKIYCDYYNSIA